jgi:phage head maturation protease
MVRELLDADVPLGASIGFRGAGKLNDDGGIHFKTIELLECSIVSVPAHPEAMRIAKAFHLEHLLPQASGSRRAASGHNPAQADTIVRAKAAILSANRTLRKKS